MAHLDLHNIKAFILEFQDSDECNVIPADIAKKPEYAGRKIYEGVVAGVAKVDDPYIVSLKANTEANLNLMQPEEWLPGARSVLSVFMPFASWIVEENAGGNWPSDGWLHGRVEGQIASDNAILALAAKIKGEGYEAVIPLMDPRYKVYMRYAGDPVSLYTANWAERHIGFAAGVGTFGLSRGIITRLGMAGRLLSIITTLPLEPTPRQYTDLYEYCIRCGACIPACPPGAISLENLKKHKPCEEFLDVVREKEAPYYGCGKCQCGLPCSSGIPG